MEQLASNDGVEAPLAHREWVRRVARALVADDSGADDLEQEVWLRAIGRGAPRSPRAWLGTVLRRLASNLGRDERRRVARESAVPAPTAPVDPSALLARAEIVERVARAVKTLPEPGFAGSARSCAGASTVITAATEGRGRFSACRSSEGVRPPPPGPFFSRACWEVSS